MAKIRKRLINQILKNQKEFIKNHPELIKEYKNLSEKELYKRLGKIITNDLPKLSKFDEKELVVDDNGIFHIKEKENKK